MKKPIIAIMYDFDKTLCTKDMQEYGFIPNVGMESADFWAEVKELTDRQEMDNILAYMYKMMEKARENQYPITRETFEELGEHIEYFEGVESWFQRINQYGEELGVIIEHYIVSSGIKEIIEGTTIAKEFKKIYACEFMYDDRTGVIQWPKFAVNYTAKTQFLFRINKGYLTIDSKSADHLNEFTPENKRRIPFRNMIYIGDGLTDVPCMKLVKSYGGQSIAVYNPNKTKEQAETLLTNHRVNFISPAQYSAGSNIEKIVHSIMKKMYAVEELETYKND